MGRILNICPLMCIASQSKMSICIEEKCVFYHHDEIGEEQFGYYKCGLVKVVEKILKD